MQIKYCNGTSLSVQILFFTSIFFYGFALLTREDQLLLLCARGDAETIYIYLITFPMTWMDVTAVTFWEMPGVGGGGGGGGTQQSFIRGGSEPRSKPLPFYIPFLIEKVPASLASHLRRYSFGLSRNLSSPTNVGS